MSSPRQTWPSSLFGAKSDSFQGFRHFPFSSPQPTGYRSGRAFSRGALRSRATKTMTASKTHSQGLRAMHIFKNERKKRVLTQNYIDSHWPYIPKPFCIEQKQKILEAREIFKGGKQPNRSPALTEHMTQMCIYYSER